MLLYLCRDQSLIKLIKPWTKPNTSGNVLTLLLTGSLLSLSNKYHELVLSSKTEYYSSFVSSVSHNPKCLWQTVNKLLHGKSSSPLPTTSGTSLADRFASFFHRQNIKTPSFTSNLAISSPHSPSAPLTSQFSLRLQNPKCSRSTHSFNGPFSGTTHVSRYQKGKTNRDFTEARDSEWQWHQLGHMQVCTCSRQTTTPAPHHSVFTGRMPFLPPNQQCQSTEGKIHILNIVLSYAVGPLHVVLLCLRQFTCIFIADKSTLCYYFL